MFAEGAGLRRFGGRGALDGVADLHIGSLGARNRALDQDQAALHVDAEHGQVQGGDGFLTHLASHLLALEGPTRILAVAGRTERAVRERDTVGGAQTAEVPALDAALEALTDGQTLHVDILAGQEVIGGQLGADIDQIVL